MKKLFFTYCCFALVTQLHGQGLSLRIGDEHTGLPVEGAHVTLLGEADTTGTISGLDGQVKFEVVRPGDKVRVTHVAYRTQEVVIHNERKTMQLFLQPLQNELNEVVVTGQTMPVQARDAVQSIRVIDARHIEEQAAVNLRDLLSNDLSIRVSEDAILGSGINLQGLGGSKVKILIDGVPVIGRLDGEIDLSQINLNDIERVEIVEGPMSVPYGTDAVAGTLNLITKKKATSRVKAKLNAYYETAGRYNVDGTISIPIRKTQTRLSLGRNFFGGYDPDPGKRNLQWNPKEQYMASLDVQHRFTRLLLRYRSDFFDEEIRNLGDVNYETVFEDSVNYTHAIAKDDYYFTRRFNNTLSAHYYVADDIKVRAFLAYNDYRREKNTLRKDLTSGEETPASGDDLQDTTRFSSLSSRLFFQHDWKPGLLNYQFGYDVNYEENRGQRLAGDYQNITDAALFTIWEYQPFLGLKVQPGLRYAYNSRFEAPLISSLALRYAVDSLWVLRASYGQGFRAPSLKELYFLFVDENHNILGNEDLKAETSNNFQAGVHYTPLLTDVSIEAGLSGFFNDIRNEIRLMSVIAPGTDNDSRGLFRNANIARSQTTGGRLSLKAQYKGWRLETGLNAIGVRNNLAFSEEARQVSQNNFNFYPQLQLNLHYTWKRPGLTASFFLNHIGRRSDLILNTEDKLVTTTFSPYTIHDVNLKKNFWSDRISLSLGVKNLWDVTQVNSTRVEAGGAHSPGGSLLVGYGRTWFTRLQFNF